MSKTLTNDSRILLELLRAARTIMVGSVCTWMFLMTAPANATTKFWDGGGAADNWSDALNWSPDGLPTSSDAVVLDNSVVNPLPQIAALSGASCGTLTLDGAVAGNFLSYAGATPYVLGLYGASVNAANTGPLIKITANAPTSGGINKLNFQLRTNGELYIETGKTFSLNNSYISESGSRVLTKTGGGTLNFSGSGPQVTFTGGFNIAAGMVITSANTLCLPTGGTITFTNPVGTLAEIQSTQSHTIAALAGGNVDSAVTVTGSNGLTVNGSANTTFGGVIQDNDTGTSLTKLTYSGSGSLTLTGVNTYTGATTITSGKLALGSTGSLDSLIFSVSGGANFDVSALPSGFTLGRGGTLSGGSGTTAGLVLGPFTAGSDSTVSPGGAGTGTLSFSNGITLASGAHLLLHLNGTTGGTGYDQLLVTAGNVVLAGDLSGSALGYTPVAGDTFYLLRNTGSGTTSGTLNGVADGGKLDFGGKWFRVSFTSTQGGAGFQTGGSGRDVAIQRINDPTPSAFAASIIGPTDQTVVQLQLTWLDNATTETDFYIYRVLNGGALQLISTLGANASSYSEVISGSAVYTYAIQAFNASGVVGDLNYVTSPNLGNTLADRQKLVLDYLQSNSPNLTQTDAGPHRIGRTGFWFGEGRLQRGDTTKGLNFIATALEDANAESSNAGFSLWPGMDAYFRWGRLFSPTLKSRYQTVYTTATLYGGSSTPNQRFMTCTGSYLANTVWGSAVNSVSSAGYSTLNLFGQTDNSSKTDVSGKTYLKNEIERVPRRGFQEDDSNHYLHFTLAPIHTLAEFAPDSSLKNKAQMTFDYGMAIAATGWLNGRNCISSSRGNVTGQQNSYDNLPRTCWLPFGGVTPNSFADAENQALFSQPSFMGVTPEIAAAATDRTKSYTRRSIAQRQIGPEVIYFKQSWMTPYYSLWSQAEGEVAFNADASFILKNMDVQAIHDGWQASRWALAWDDPTGTDSTLHLTAPTNYKTATNSGMSIYEDTLQKEDTMIAVYNIPTTDFTSGNNGVSPCHLLNGHISTQYLAITDESATTGRIFLHYNNVLVALYLSAPFSWSNNFQISPWSKGSLAVETAPLSDYPQTTAAARLAAFRNDVLTNGSVNISSINATAPRFIYKTRKGRILDLTYGQAGIVDNDPVDYLQWPMLESPSMVQPQMGNLFIFGADRSILYNFYDWTTTINNRPTITSASPVFTATATPVDIDLTTRTSDAETTSTKLAFAVSSASNGTVQLLPDGHTARFTPSAGYLGAAAFNFAVNDRGIDSRLLLDYDFEPPATLSGGIVTDVSRNARDATALAVASGTASLDTTTSPPAMGANGTQSLRLNENGTSAFRLTRTVTQSNLQMSNGSWTFGGWFKRASRTADDFIFYVGNGDGFGGTGDELQLYCAANNDLLALRHYNAASPQVQDVSLTSAATVGVNQWHHVALTFTRTALNTGNVSLYLDGTLVGTASNITWALHQDLPMVFGGHASTTGSINRYFDGWLDDLALFRGALSGTEVASLATQSVATFGGFSARSLVNVAVVTPLQAWRQQYFGTTANTATATDSADSDGDGATNLMEYAVGTDPTSAASVVRPTLGRSGNFLTLSFNRLQSDVTYIVEGSSDLTIWSTLATNPGSVGQSVTVADTADISTAGPSHRFLRLRVTNP